MNDNRQESKEVELRAWLQSLDPLLDVVYLEWAERYSLICNWPQADLRWSLFQSGEIGAHYDSLGWLCKDPGDASSVPLNLDEVENVVIRLLAACDNTRQDWKVRMKDTIVHNRKVKDDRKKIALDQAEEVARSLRFMAGHNDANKMERIMQEVAEGIV